MGAGSGTLDEGTPYDVTLTFGPDSLSRTAPMYTNFKSGLIFLLAGLKGITPPAQVATYKEIPDPADNGKIAAISVHIEGPLRGTNRENFNRAFNRLLWGLRFRRTSGEPSLSNIYVTPDDQNWHDEQT